MGLKMNIKIMITDNHLLIREGIKRILEELENIEIVGESGNIDDAKLKEIESIDKVILMIV